MTFAFVSSTGILHDRIFADVWHLLGSYCARSNGQCLENRSSFDYRIHQKMPMPIFGRNIAVRRSRSTCFVYIERRSGKYVFFSDLNKNWCFGVFLIFVPFWFLCLFAFCAFRMLIHEPWLRFQTKLKRSKKKFDGPVSAPLKIENAKKIQCDCRFIWTKYFKFSP